MHIEERLLWDEFNSNKSLDNRNRLAEYYLPLVDKIAIKLKNGFPDCIDIQDLKQEGVMGLMQALASFDPNRTKRFSTFAQLRIRGSMLDGLRRVDWVPRSVRSKIRKLEKAITTLTSSLGKKPNYTELSKNLEITHKELKKWLKLLPPTLTDFTHLSTKDEDSNYEELLAENGRVSNVENPDYFPEIIDLNEYLKKDLSDRNRTILEMHLQGYKGIEIAQKLGVSESLISVTRKPLFNGLREKLEELELC